MTSTNKLKLSSIKVPRNRVEQGDWIEYTPWASVDGKIKPRFRVSGISSTAYRRATEEASKRFAMKYKGETIPDDVLHRRNAELIAEHLLHDWEGLDEPYSADLAEQLLSDRDYEPLANAVVWCARKLEEVNVEFTEEAEKNSAAPSATS